MSALKVQITWPNAGTALLPEAGSDVKLLAGGAALTPVQSSKGLRVFDVPDGTTQLELKAVFTASFAAVNGTTKSKAAVSAPAMSGEVLRAEQKYTVAGVALTAQSIGDFGGPHPLVVTKGAANKNGVVSITLRTEFVDVGAFWEKYCAFWPYYLGEHKGNTTVHVLGHTGGSPLIWFAIVPNGMASQSNGFTSCLVFYRPANYVYSRLDQPHEATAIARYFCTPKDDANAKAADFERDHVTATGYNLMRCRFEEVIDDSKRAVVMLHPWNSGTGFGAASTSALPGLCEGAIRLLRVKKAVCKGVANVSLGRLGISAFSRGGEAMWAALKANMPTVREVYAFDCVGSEGARGDIVQWWNSKDTNMVRLVGGAYNVSLYNAIARTLSPQLKHPLVTVTPKSTAEYDPGGNIVWDHYLSLFPSARNDSDTRHQFAICGGTMAGNFGPYDLDLMDTYLSTFLKASGFNRL